MTPLAEPTYMTDVQADAIFTVLVEECGAPERIREEFVSNYTARIARTPNTSEYRFSGALGFGGKFKFQRRRWYVDCYPEDETSERIAMIERANVRIQLIRESA